MLENMRILRKKHGMTMKELGELVGVAEITISTYETGKREPPLETLCQIADVLDVSLDMLVRGKEKDRPAGRSLTEVAKGFKALSDEHLEMMIATATAVLAERRFQVRQEKERKETE